MPLRMIHESTDDTEAAVPRGVVPEGPVIRRTVGVRHRLRRFKEWLLQWH